jgi:hypothetical protein
MRLNSPIVLVTYVLLIPVLQVSCSSKVEFTSEPTVIQNPDKSTPSDMLCEF